MANVVDSVHWCVSIDGNCQIQSYFNPNFYDPLKIRSFCGTMTLLLLFGTYVELSPSLNKIPSYEWYKQFSAYSNSLRLFNVDTSKQSNRNSIIDFEKLIFIGSSTAAHCHACTETPLGFLLICKLETRGDQMMTNVYHRQPN